MGSPEGSRPELWLPPEPAIEKTPKPEQAKTELPPGIQHIEYRNGLPVLDQADFFRLYNTDIRALGEKNAATFNFQGFVRDRDEDDKVVEIYKDVLATNGLLKAEGHDGIHVGTDGIVDYGAMVENHRMTGPQDVGEYDVYIQVPSAVQKAQGVVVNYDSCYSEADYLKRFGASAEEITERRAGRDNDFIVMRLNLEPKDDPLAREKAALIHNSITSYIESGRPLPDLEQTIRDLERSLAHIKPEDLARKALDKRTPKLKP